MFPEASLELVPVADGGDGTLDAMVAALHGRVIEMTVTGPDGKPVKAAYGLMRSPSAMQSRPGAVEFIRPSAGPVRGARSDIARRKRRLERAQRAIAVAWRDACSGDRIDRGKPSAQRIVRVHRRFTPHSFAQFIIGDRPV